MWLDYVEVCDGETTKGNWLSLSTVRFLESLATRFYDESIVLTG